MTALPDRNSQVRRIFDRAVELPAGERASFLARECGPDATLRRELDTLLRLHAEAREAIIEPAPIGEQPGDRIGHYKLRQKIGEGGFGAVWVADQEQPVRRRVALKVLKAGMDTAQVMARFEAERQALAMMDHPNIARVFDGGSTPQGRPYFVMELVKGVPITKYCDEAGSSLSERLELFVAVCHAVQHAHQKGVIHRDLKPSNVLVTLHDGEPVPKVIDFGIAKATQGRLAERTVFTEFRQMLGTPEYMAPEQAELSGLDVDTRADIYSLGVLLYELLTGTRPFEIQSLLQAGFDAMLKTIKEIDPPIPSTRVSTLGEQLIAIAGHRKVQPKSLRILIRGDLDWIVMKALEKERGRRYGTATALADDVRRHLRDEPVLASPPSRVYRLRKYVRRHRVGVAATLAVGVALGLGLIGTWIAYRDARAQEAIATESAAQAERERSAAVLAQEAERRQRLAAEAAETRVRQEVARSQAVVRLLRTTLAAADPHDSKGRDYPVRLVLADFERALQEQAAPDPEVEATLRAVVGESYLGLGLADAAAPHVHRVLELRIAAHGARHLEVAGAHLLDACLRHDRNEFDAALVAIDAAVAALPGDGSAEETEQRILLDRFRTDLLRHLGRVAEAETTGRACLAAAQRHLGDEHAEVQRILSELARVLSDRGDPGAEGMCRAALDLARKLHGSEDPAVAAAGTALARLLNDRGDYAEAEAIQRESLRVSRSSQGDDHLGTWVAWASLASILSNRHDYPAAEALVRELLAVQRRILKAEDPELAKSLELLGECLRGRDDFAGAERALREALAIRRAARSDKRALVVTGLQLGGVLFDAGNLDGAEPFVRDAIDLFRDAPEAPSYELVKALNLLGGVHWHRGELAESEPLLRESLAVLDVLRKRRKPPEILGTRLRWYSTLSLGHILRDRGDDHGAEAAFREALAVASTDPGADPRGVATIEYHLAKSLRKRDDLAGAEDLERRALEVRRKTLPDGHVDLAVSLSDLGVLRDSRGDHEEAARLHREALPHWIKLRGQEHADVAACMANIGRSLSKLGELDEAEETLRGAIAMRRKVHGGEHELIGQDLVGLALVLGKRKDLVGAGRCYIEGMAMLRRIHGPEHQDLSTPAIARNLAISARNVAAGGDVALAAAGHREALAIRRRLHGDDDLDVANSQAALAQCLLQLGEFVEAEALARSTLAIRAARAPDTWLHDSAILLLGRALAGQDRFADAEPLLVAACGKAQPAKNDEYLLRNALTCLIEGYERNGRAAEAAPWKEKLRLLTGGELPSAR